MYPLNLVADLNAVLGIVYVHMYGLDVSLPDDPTTSPAYQGTHGDTSYYFFETQDLPLFGPLRTLGVPERLIDVVEPFFRVIVEAGYDRSIKPWKPTPARLIPPLNPGKVAADLAAAIDEGIDNARHLIGPPPTSANLRRRRVIRAPSASRAPGPSRHRLGPREMPLEAKRFRHRAVTITTVTVRQLVATSLASSVRILSSVIWQIGESAGRFGRLSIASCASATSVSAPRSSSVSTKTPVPHRP